MDKNIQSSEEQQESIIENSLSIGQVLKAGRIEKKLEVEQVAKQLNLSSNAIEYLEADNYDELPEMAYVRGYIVLYCRLLGLNSDEVLKNLNYDEQDELSINRSLNISMKPQANSAKGGSTLLKAILTICVVIGILWLYMQSKNSNSLIASQDKQESLSQSASTENFSDQSNAKNEDKLEESQVPSSYSSIQDDQGNPTDPVEQENTTAKPAVSAEQKSLLELEFNSISWVDVQDAKKKKIIYQSFPRGEKYKVKVKLPLNVFIDNAEGVVMRYEGRVIDLNARIQDGGYAKFTLSE